jgi:hypothetical protein
MRVTLLAALLLLSACATPPRATGRFAQHLTDSDVREITRAAREVAPKDHLVRITVDKPAVALVDFVKYDESGSITTTVNVVRKSGKWVVDEKMPFRVRGHFVVDVS